MYAVENYSNNNMILDSWCSKDTILKLKSVNQVLYSDGKIHEDIERCGNAWFLLELTDGSTIAYVELQINKTTEMDNNSLKVDTIYDYFKTINYVDKLEWDDFFKCRVVKQKNCHYLMCISC